MPATATAIAMAAGAGAKGVRANARYRYCHRYGRGRRKGGTGDADEGGGAWGFCGILRGKDDSSKGQYFLSGGLGVGPSLRRKLESIAACRFRLAPE